ncbi:MAG: MgtC/SapB family protein [Agathobacter sp.]|nr:MgtC/SapB family protein [Agathobacter sp.]
MEEFVNAVKDWSFFSITFRLVFSVVTGFLIGIDRAMKRRGAGIKTHVLVCLGACLVMITGQFITLNYSGDMDVSRLGAQVINGVGFLGVGTIIVTGRNQVRGLTTAAGLWACACIGLAIGIGFVDGAAVALILAMFTFKVLNRVDSVVHHYAKIFDLYIEFDSNQSVSEFVNELHKRQIKISNFELGKSKIPGDGPNALICVELKERGQRDKLMHEIRSMECVRYVEEY